MLETSNGFVTKNNMYCVIKREDANQFLTKEEILVLDGFLQKIELGRASIGKKPCNEYYVCNVNEPYAENVHNAIVTGELAKGNPTYTGSCGSGNTQEEYEERM